MADIVVTKKDDVYLKVQCEPSIAQELHTFFCFDVINYYFTKIILKKFIKK